MNTAQVNAVRGLKREGDLVKRCEALVEPETERVSYELEPLEKFVLPSEEKIGHAVRSLLVRQSVAV